MAANGYLLDANVLSETRKRQPYPGVLDFLRAVFPARIFLSALTVGELHKGAAAFSLRHGRPDHVLEAWIGTVEKDYADRILSVDREIARQWGAFSAGRTRPVVDTLLAATAIHHGLTLVTRNTRDVEDLPVQLRNPWIP